MPFLLGLFYGQDENLLLRACHPCGENPPEKEANTEEDRDGVRPWGHHGALRSSRA